MRAPILLLAVAAFVCAQSRSVPAHEVPVPDLVSERLRANIARPIADPFPEPKTPAEWKKLQDARAADRAKGVPALLAKLHVKMEPRTVAGVKTFMVTPETVAPENRKRILVHVHGGAYVFFGGESGTPEAILMAHYGKIPVISVDYRMPPDHPFPAAIDDTVAVWKEMIRTHKPAAMGLFGTSTGGGLTLATVLRLKQLGIPIPGAIAPGTPWSDLTKTGDTYFTNERIDNVLVDYERLLGPCARLYAAGRDLEDPLLSPVYGDFHGFPPAILLSGTRDLFLSNTVRVHRKLRAAGIEAELHVFEAQSHGQYMLDQVDSEESRESFTELSRFFSRHLSR
ncbi:MAG: alpha/beta hydrolase [Bryobacteraceae bacterium]